MKLIRHSLATVGLLIGLALVATPVAGQTTVNSTTLSAALAANSRVIALASVSNIAVNDLLVVVYGNRAAEAMQVNAVNTASVDVQRGVAGTAARAWASGATVYTGGRARFYNNEVMGTCTSTSEQYLPHISLPSGNIYQCSPAGTWYRLDQTFTATCRMLLFADMVDQSCITIDRPLVLVGATYVSKVVEAAGTLTVRIMREQGTEAAASGDLLATALSGVSTVAETVTSYTLSATSSFLLLSSGERLGVDFTDDVAGELAGVTITFTLAPR